MRRRPVEVGLFVVFVSILCVVMFSIVTGPAGPVADGTAYAAASGAQSATLVERGRYLVGIAGCNDCHTPKKMTPQGPVLDETRLLSGHPAGTKLPAYEASKIAPGQWVLLSEDLTACVGPWGVTYAVNLTPDDATGIGLWTEEIFISALRTGKHMGAGRPIMPPMPWQNLNGATDEDLKAIYAYLRSLPPIRNAVPGMQPLTKTGS